jgi:Ca-activated chloride channel homolog
MSFVSFQNAQVLLLLFIVPLLWLLYRRSVRKKRASAMKFSTLSILSEAKGKGRGLRQHVPFSLIVIAIALIIVGFADPTIPLEQTKEGVNVVLSMDVSGSMQATDYKPSRIEAAKSAAEILIKSLQEKDQVGIVTFQAGAATSSYLTPFKDRAQSKLEGVQASSGSTALGDGLAMAVDMATSIPNKKKIVILLSDGVSNSGAISPQEAVAYAKSSQVQVYTVGMGTEGRTVIGYDFFGTPQYAELDEATLKAIADATHGKYYKSVDENTLDQIYKSISGDIKREKEPTSIKDWLFYATLGTLLVLLYISYGQRYRIIC